MAKINAMIVMVVFVMVMITAGTNYAAEGAGINCGTVVSSLMPCETYLTQGGSLPAACCSGVSSLNKAASTMADRQTACECIKTAARQLNVNPKYAATLPSDCNVNIGYAISYSTNCNNVK